MKPLNESSVLVTGASGGIGRACVEAFLQAGAHVVATDIDEGGRSFLEPLHGERCTFLSADLREKEAVEHLIDVAGKKYGGLDVLVNNAAVIQPLAPVHTTTLQDFDRLLAVNLRSVFLCCKYAYPYLRQSQGCIINMSSMAGVQGEKDHAIYCATKGALNALTKAMAVDYGPEGIRCNAVCPSSVLTPSTNRLIQASPDPEGVIEMRKAINLLGYTL